jgi:glycosyltransferase involved in cell wall biosynthesis
MRRQVRVAHILGSTGLYGAERWVLALLRYLPPIRVHATVVNLVDAANGCSEVVAAARERGFPACDFPTGGRFNPAAIVRLSRQVRLQGYTLLHSHGYKSDLVALCAARIAGVRVVSTPHGWSQEREPALAFYESLDRVLLRFVDVVCPLSPDLQDNLRRWKVPERKLRLISNALDLAEIQEAAVPAQRPNGGIVVGYIGQLLRRKNLECLLTAFARLARPRSAMRLTIVGEGPLAGELRRLTASLGVEGRVWFTGYRPDRLAMLKTFDVLVLPSWQEGIPRCLMEAMAARVPVVASDIPGTRELIHDGRTGLLFRPDDPDQLAQAIATVLDRQELRQALTEHAHAHVVRHFSASRMAEAYADLYESC